MATLRLHIISNRYIPLLEAEPAFSLICGKCRSVLQVVLLNHSLPIKNQNIDNIHEDIVVGLKCFLKNVFFLQSFDGTSFFV